MNIVIVTQWYPFSKGTDPTKKTFAIHNFAKIWSRNTGAQIRVITPHLDQKRNISIGFIDNIKIISVKYNVRFWTEKRKFNFFISEILRIILSVLKRNLFKFFLEHLESKKKII